MISSSLDWDSFWASVEAEVTRTKVVGFDCEWVSEASKQIGNRSPTTKAKSLEQTTTEGVAHEKDSNDNDDCNLNWMTFDDESSLDGGNSKESSPDVDFDKELSPDDGSEGESIPDGEFQRDQASPSAITTSVASNEVRGFDGRVSMIQIATADGYCALIRILALARHNQIPETLTNLLRNKNILKLGVSPKDDANRLFKDYG